MPENLRAKETILDPNRVVAGDKPDSVGVGGVLVEDKEGQATSGSGFPMVPDDGIPINQRIEVSPIRNVTMERLCKRIDNQGGAALIIDYGEDFPQPNTLQGVKDHKFARVLESPGEVDISAHVDFSALSTQARMVSNQLQVFPVVPQGMFLINLNIEARMQALCQGLNDEEKENVQQAVMRIVSEEDMGLLFKVLAVTQPGIGAPAGFPEDASGGGVGPEEAI
mmetsp:Transcript_27007/g.47770  ORF Transcript_27007/g.47770 Transcript_27007/m.47770 type:complete len:224 (+) Transcript_27007:3-674(+)